MRRACLAIAAGAALLALADVRTPAQSAYEWTLPAGFRPPSVPGDNPMSEAKVTLGRYLFYDTRLSGNGTQSCGTCHEQSRAFTDGRARSVGSTGEAHPRGSMSLVNVAYAQALTWANPSSTSLEEQALVPMYGEWPIELGLNPCDAWVEPLARDHIVKAIAASQRAIVSARSPYDRYHFDRDEAAISEPARRGEVLLACTTWPGRCRIQPVAAASTNLTQGVTDVGSSSLRPCATSPSPRRRCTTEASPHWGTPLDHYEAGGRTVHKGPNRGAGHDNPNKSAAIRGFQLTAGQRADLIAFLQSLTDEALLRDPRFANPWTAARAHKRRARALHLRSRMKSLTRHLYFWVLLAILAGGTLGYADPATAVKLKPLGDGFIALVKMLISPIIFCTVVLGIAGAGDMKKVGRVGGKALIYFEVVSTVALAIGLVVINLVRPGAGFNVDPATLDAKAVADYATRAEAQSTVDFILNVIPTTFTDAFTGSGDLLQVLFVSVLFGYAMTHMGAKGATVHNFIEACSHIFFAMMNALMKLAPIGAGGAMAFTIGRYGIDSLRPLAALMGSFYLTCLLFVLVVLGTIAAFTGFSILKFIAYIKDELLTVLGTSSSESALVPLMQKLERLGCSRSVVGLVVPAGYSFNLDGTNIYLTMAALFVAQALNIELSLRQQLTVLGVAMLTSKGASGVTGAGFITLAATLAVVPSIPVAGLALILGIDRFMSEARSITNFIGNGVAAVVVARWEGELDTARLTAELAGRASMPPPTDRPQAA